MPRLSLRNGVNGLKALRLQGLHPAHPVFRGPQPPHGPPRRYMGATAKIQPDRAPHCDNPATHGNDLGSESMPNLYFAREPFHASELFGNDREAFKAFCRNNSAGNLRVLHRHTAYCLSANGPGEQSAVQKIATLPAPEREKLAACTRELGDDIHAVSDFVDRNLRWVDGGPVSLVGAGATAVDTRLTGFQQALHRYQAALLELRDFESRGAHRHTQGRGVGHHRSNLESAVRDAYQDLDQRFRAEMDRAVPGTNRYKNRGNALSNAERGMTLAHRSATRKPDPRLFVADAMDATRLERFARMTRGIGHGAIALDAGFRINRVYSDYHDEDEDWMRTAAEETASFGTAGLLGLHTGKATVKGAGLTAVALGIAITPVGWAGIIAGGVAIGAGAGYLGDRFGRTVTSWISEWFTD